MPAKNKIGDLVYIHTDIGIDCGILVNIAPDIKIMPNEGDYTIICNSFDEEFSSSMSSLVQKLRYTKKFKWLGIVALAAQTNRKLRECLSDVLWFIHMHEETIRPKQKKGLW